LGLGNLRDIYSVIVENDELVLKITGEIFGSLNDSLVVSKMQKNGTTFLSFMTIDRMTSLSS
ncbi:MAG: hypothetical protein AAGJ18_24320, partial [Bacteroidota bacterium]